LSIRVTSHGKLDTNKYPFQISEVSQLLRDETLPILRNYTETSRLKLVSEQGHFPEHIRRRLPTHILRAVRIITILDNVGFDELKPCLRNFPNLLRLEFDYYSLEIGFDPSGKIDAAPSNAPVPWSSSSEESYSRRTGLLELHREQERPREGLERDYFPENTLWQACRMSRARRGYDITARARVKRLHLVGSYREDIHMVQVLDLEKEYSPFPSQRT